MQEDTPLVPSRGAQDSVVKIHQHLVDISRLACQSNDELLQHQSDYEQAYLSERRKLDDLTVTHNTLAQAHQRLEQENAYLKHQLIPKHEKNLERQEGLSTEARILVKSLETKLQVLEKVSSDEQQKHTQALEAATHLLNMQAQAIKTLSKDGEMHPTASQAPTAQLRRSSRLEHAANVQASEPLRSRKTAQTNPKPKKLRSK